MAKLLSHHDRFHVHAILGFSCLVHFVVRIGGLFFLAKDTFTTSAWSVASLLLHAMLHATSFQFHLPRNRQWSQPMIWKEFRVHNALFAYRHLVGCALGIWCADWWWRHPMTISSLLVKVAVVLGTSKAADITTAQIGSRELRTTNAMPYPEKVPGNVVSTAKRFYAKSQFAAAALAVFGTPILSFASILAIEVASFLMTLVRKGIVSSAVYHIIYALSLFIMMPCMVVTLFFMEQDVAMATFRAMTVTALAIPLRFQLRIDRYLTWLLSILAGSIAAEVFIYLGCPLLIAVVGMLWSAGDTLQMLTAREGAASNSSEPQSTQKEPIQMPAEQPSQEADKLSRRGPQGGS
mmetsp:Transcript_4646/g.11253  ORF Transcript_4646/g.11253 Transcript_4646/m.11253 type:complete len:350 (+) Transcript_4646:83-1132(+)